jgi:four helix bundle protein
MERKKYLYAFEKLEVWQDARSFVKKVYAMSSSFPEKEKFGLTNQIRRASISIAANIAEGSSRLSKKDFAHFLQIAYSSLMEVLSHCYLAHDLLYINEENMIDIRENIYMISNKINALYRSQIHN